MQLCSFSLLMISAPLWTWLWLQCWFLPTGEALEEGKSFQLSVGKEGAAVVGKEQSKGGTWTRRGSVGFMGTPQRLSLSVAGLYVSVNNIHLL